METYVSIWRKRDFSQCFFHHHHSLILSLCTTANDSPPYLPLLHYGNERKPKISLLLTAHTPAIYFLWSHRYAHYRKNVRERERKLVRERRKKIPAYIIIICSTGDLPILSSSYRITIDGICQCFYPPLPFSLLTLWCYVSASLPLWYVCVCSKVSYVLAPHTRKPTERDSYKNFNASFIFPTPLNFLRAYA